MSRWTIPLCVAALFVGRSAQADVLKLSNGGELKGTLDAVSFLVAGKELHVTRADVPTLLLSKDGKDTVQLKDGTRHEGEVLSVKFRSVGGALTFPRKDIQSVTLTADPLADARRELAKRRAALALKDAAGLFELALWCKAKGLKAEAVGLARASLAADAESDCAARAHQFLGHVEYEGEWMPQAEALRRRANADPWTERKDQPGDGPRPEPKEPDPKKLTPGDRKAIKDALAKNEELYETYKTKAGEKKTERVGAIKAAYQSHWKSTLSAIEKLKQGIAAKERKRRQLGISTAPGTRVEVYRGYLLKKRLRKTDTELVWEGTAQDRARIDRKYGYQSGDRYLRDVKGRGNTYLARRIDDSGTSDSRTFKDGLDEDRAALKKRRVTLLKLRRKIKSAMSKAAQYGSTLRGRVRLAYLKNQRLLLGGRKLGPEGLTAHYEEALK